MKRRKHRYRGYSKRTIILTIALFCSLFFGLGYSLLGTSLDLSGIISVQKYDQSLYGVLEKEAKKGTYAERLSNSYSHKDSYLLEPTKNIYSWKRNSDLKDEILNKQNVIFAGHCWQMYRTTDVGGVRMIYNGEAVNDQCLSTRGKHVGYSSSENISLSNTYYYGTDYSYNSNSGLFELNGTIITGTINVGYYTCLSSSITGTCSTLYLVEKDNGTNYTVIKLSGNSPYSQFGSIRFNSSADSMAYIGYMYNKVYQNYNLSPVRHSVTGISQPASGTINFGTDIIYSDGVYTLQNVIQDEWSNFYSSSAGYYMCSSGEASCSNVYYLLGGDSRYFYSIYIWGGHYLDYFDTYYYYGDGFTDNGDDTYTINNSYLVKHSDWGIDPTGHAGHYYCEDSPVCSNPRYIISANSLDFLDIYPITYKYAYGFTYENGLYHLDNDSVDIWNYVEDSNLDNHRYTCLNESGECSTLYYVYNKHSSMGIFYIGLTNGINVSDSIEEMIYDENVNQYSSEIKFAAESWYKKYLRDYSSYIDDNIFSYCRGIYNDDSGWNSELTNIKKQLHFITNSSLTCNNETDLFSMTNPKAKLLYPIGILNYYEWVLLGNARSTGNGYILYYPDEMSSSTHAYFQSVSSTGGISNVTSLTYNSGATWIISLRPGIEFVSGTGSMADPYIVDAEPLEPEDYNTLTIHYYLHESEYGPVVQEIFDPVEVTLPYGSDYYYESPEYPHTRIDMPVVSGVLYNDTDIEVHYYQKRYTLTINYWYSDWTKAANSFTNVYLEGDQYNVASPNIDGYDADNSRVMGTITSDTEYDVVYTPRPFTLTVRFIYQDGTEAAPTHTETHTCINESYSVELPVISGFTPSRPSPVTGNMPCRNTPLTIIYLPNSGGS